MERRVLRTWANDAAQFALVLRRHDATWQSETFELAGGHVVLCGAGMYVNRAMAVGLDEPVTPGEFDQLETRSTAVGVAAAIEVSPSTRPEVAAAAAARGYALDGTVNALRRGLDDVDELPLDSAFVIEPAADQLGTWQATSTLGWGHTSIEARRASDAFAAAASVVDGDGLVVARDAADRRPVGCASVTINEGVATLGGMSTIPGERGRGVQRALIAYRLRFARSAGCEIATTTASVAGASERNLMRHGFEPWFAIDTLVRRPPAR